MSKFAITNIESIRVATQEGKSLCETEKRPERPKDLQLSDDIRKLLISSTIPLEWMHSEPFINYGRDISTSTYDKWEWDINKINSESNEGVLWRMYGQISGYWLINYQYWYDKCEYEFKQYRFKNGDDTYCFKI